MPAIKNSEDLSIIRSRVERRKASWRYRLLVCGDTGCHAAGSHAVKEALAREIEGRGLAQQVQVVLTGCNGFCSVGPLMTVYPGGIFYQKLQPDDVVEIVESHLLAGRPVERLMYHELGSNRPLPSIDQIPYFTRQHLRVMRSMGKIDPESIEEYIAEGGYAGAAKAFLQMQPRQIIRSITESGLRGRGGGGFPTGLKWEFCANARGDTKYVLCNADEGDPGAFMDRAVMEATPHAVIEGMIIASRAIGSRQGYIYCRAEYPLAVKRLNLAIEQARACDLLGGDIFGTGHAFDIEVYMGAGAFVCGEETALMASIEGRRGMPRPRPPFPAVSGLWQKPTVLNNVETYANVPQIIIEGPQAFGSLGTASSRGTKVFAVTGKVNNIGLVEVPMGTSIGEIVFDICGGIPAGKKFKAAQLGGPSGGCLPTEHLNTPVDYEEISRAGAIMGSGGLIVMDEDTCMVDMARYFMDFCQDESCGKCTPCRVGTRRMLEILQRICRGQGQEGDLELLEDLAATIKDSALCGLGQTAPNPVLSTMRYFRDEYLAHIREKRCPAGACSALVTSPCQNACPAGMDVPAYLSLVAAGRLDDAYRVLLRTNPFPSVCGRICGHPCQAKCRRGQLDEPLAIKHLKRFITDHGRRPPVEPVPVSRAEKIAVIGAGPAGLTAAWELRRRGYAVCVFEAQSEAGGMLRWGIPAYRLPREVLRREIQAILDSGVELKLNVRIGKQASFSELQRAFDFLYVAAGAQRSAPLGIEGEKAAGVLGAVEMLREATAGRRPELGRKVAVIGGGNTAVDAARTALRLGAEEVSIFYRRERRDMPALAEEIRAAEEEGVRLVTLVAPVRVLEKRGRVAGLELCRQRLGKFDRSGRRTPEPCPEETFTVEADCVLSATGQVVDLDFLEGSGLEVVRGTVRADRSGRTGQAKVLAGGDVVTGPAMAIDAIAAGRRAAEAIDDEIRQGRGEKPWQPPPDGIEIPYQVQENLVETPAPPMPSLEPGRRRASMDEVELGYPAEAARAEARRCLRCDMK